MNFHIGIIAFSFLYSPIGLIIGIFMNILSRKNEFEADSYVDDEEYSTVYDEYDEDYWDQFEDDDEEEF